MKTQNPEQKKDIFKGFELTNEEMINVRGGDPGAGSGDFPVPPPTKI